MNFGPDAWDDSTILDIFDEAIRSHRTKKDKVSFSLRLPHRPFGISLIVLTLHIRHRNKREAPQMPT